jgi:quercetin dioxygenase-like cupin family protein
MMHTLRMLARSTTAVCAALCAFAAGSAAAQEPSAAAPPGPPVIFRAPLADVPGKELVVVALSIPPARATPSPAHTHPGSVYVYVTAGTARFGVAGQPVKEVKTGESFFEPPGALHTVMESAHPTEGASAIAVMIVPNGAALATPANPR